MTIIHRPGELVFGASQCLLFIQTGVACEAADSSPELRALMESRIGCEKWQTERHTPDFKTAENLLRAHLSSRAGTAGKETP
jgi:hypothetical protein